MATKTEEPTLCFQNIVKIHRFRVSLSTGNNTPAFVLESSTEEPTLIIFENANQEAKAFSFKGLPILRTQELRTQINQFLHNNKFVVDKNGIQAKEPKTLFGFAPKSI